MSRSLAPPLSTASPSRRMMPVSRPSLTFGTHSINGAPASELRPSESAGAELHKLRLKLLGHGVRNIMRAAGALLFIPVLPLLQVLVGTGKAELHRHGIDQHLELVAELHLDGAGGVRGFHHG